MDLIRPLSDIVDAFTRLYSTFGIRNGEWNEGIKMESEMTGREAREKW